MTAKKFEGLELKLLPTDKEHLYRVWRHPGGDWEPTGRSGAGRIDCLATPPQYFVLYLATSPLVALQETLLLTAQPPDRWLFHRARAAEYNLTSYATTAPLRAATLDEPNAELLGLDRVTLIEGKRPYRLAAMEIRQVRGADVPALVWRSKHREANGQVVGLFHDRKSEVGLSIVRTVKLLDHPVIDDLMRLPALILS